MQDTAEFPALHHFLDPCRSFRFFNQTFQAEHGTPPVFMPQRHVTGRFVEICPKAAVPDPGAPGQQIGKDLDHQVLCLVNIIEIAVYVQSQGIAVFFHQLRQPCFVAVQITAVKFFVGHCLRPPVFHLL